MNYSMLLARPTRRPPPPTIAILSQPQDATSSIAPVVSEFSAALPSPVTGIWSRDGDFTGAFFAARGINLDCSVSSCEDFLATAFWGGPSQSPSLSFSKRSDITGFGGSFVPLQGDGELLAATQASFKGAVSSDGGNTWSAFTPRVGGGEIFYVGGFFMRGGDGLVEKSLDALNWTPVSTPSLDDGVFTFGYADGGWFFAVDPPFGNTSSVGGLYASSDGQTFIKIQDRDAGGVGDNIESVVKFGDYWYVATAGGALQKTDRLTSTYASGISSLFSYGSQVAASSQALVAYSKNATIHYSADGATWTQATLPIILQTQRRGTLFAAANHFFLVLGASPSAAPEQRYLVGSPDGASWQLFTRATPCLTTRLYPRSKTYTLAASDGTRTRDYTFACDTNGSNEFHVLQIAGVRNNATFSVSASATSGGLSYSWQRLFNGEWTDLSQLINQSTSGIQTPTLTVIEPTAAFNGSQYRCVVTASGAKSVISSPATLTVI